MKCTYCKTRELTNPKAKFCSGACKIKSQRNKSVSIIKPDVSIIAKNATGEMPVSIIQKKYPPGAFSYAFCDGCDGSNCPSGFKPNKGNIEEMRKLLK